MKPSSLENNLIPSAKGCKTPNKPTFIGPLRACLKPNTFRSSNVIKATQSKTTRTTERKFNKKSK